MIRDVRCALAVAALTGACSKEPTPAPAPSATTAAPIATAPSSPRPLVVHFTRDFCLPCQEMKPTIDALRRETRGAVDVAVVNVDRPASRPLAAELAITSVPTQIYVDAEGAVVARHEGLATAEEMRAEVTRLRRPAP